MKIFYDLLPVILFFIIYKFYGIYAATLALIIVAVIQFVALLMLKKRVDKLQLFVVIMVVVLGGLTLLSHNPQFIQWKVSVVNWVFALVFLGSHFVGKRCLMERAFADKVNLPRSVFVKMNIMWAIYFLVVGFINLYVMYFFDLNTWVNFKLFGLLIIGLIFLVIQVIYFACHLRKQNKS